MREFAPSSFNMRGFKHRSTGSVSFTLIPSFTNHVNVGKTLSFVTSIHETCTYAQQSLFSFGTSVKSLWIVFDVSVGGFKSFLAQAAAARQARAEKASSVAEDSS